MATAGRGTPGTRDEGISSHSLPRGVFSAGRSSERSSEPTRPALPAGLSSSVRITCAAISWLTRGRFTDGHDELLYVIRKPLDCFARVV